MDTYYCVETYQDGSEHEMRIGKQLKRARDTAQRMLRNELIAKVEIVQYFDGFSRKFIEAITR